MKINFFWFRRDLRLEDNAGLYHALKSGMKVQCLFIFDSEILNLLENKKDRRVIFIFRQLEKIDQELKKYDSSLLIKYGSPLQVWNELLNENKIDSVFCNHDYEPYATERDSKIKELLSENSIQFHTYKDQVVFEKNEITKDDGLPYTVFTPYMKKWRAKFTKDLAQPFSTEKYFKNFNPSTNQLLKLEEFGFTDSGEKFGEPILQKQVLDNYSENRDIPSINGTSRLSVHLRFGTVSIRKLILQAWSSEKWINELIWREYYMMILWHFPHVVHSPFRSKYNFLQWENNEEHFQKWCEGKTGYPIVDAGMRELNTTGFMHNRVRMIVAMFLTKYLLIDWRWGEAYFAEKLLDYELASNNGGWQWSAGTGVDAAPYFRIFSMDEQTKRFDPNFLYIKKWVPEFQDLNYPPRLIDYSFARKRCLEFFKTTD